MTDARAGVPLVVKAGWGAGELGMTAAEFFVQVYLLKLYTEGVGLEPGAAGLALALAVAWDAAADPLVGALSDRTRTGWGKRRPYFILGAPALALTFVLLFAPPALASQVGKAAFLLSSYLLFNTAMAVVTVPHTALGGELSDDPGERTALFGWRFLFINLGLVTGILVPGLAAVLVGPELAVDVTPADALARARLAAYWIALAVVATAWVAAWATRGRDEASAERGRLSLAALARGLASVARNRPFRVLLVTFIVGSVARAVNASTALFYYQHRLRLAEGQVFLHVLLPFTLLIALSILAWTRLARRFGKKRAACAGVLSLGVLTTVAYPLLPAGQVAPAMAVAVLGGLFAGAVFLLDSTVADVVEYDELKTGEHREGLYFGLWRMATKLARAAGLVLSGVLLQAVGFHSGASVQGSGVGRGLALVFGPGVGLLFVAAAVVYMRMPLDDDTHRRVLRLLARRAAVRRAREAAFPAASGAGGRSAS